MDRRDKTVKVWDASTGQETLTLRGHTEEIERRLQSRREADREWVDDETVKVWDASTGQES